MEGVDDGDARWFCPTCAARKVNLVYFHVSAYQSYQSYQHPPRKPPPSLLSSLIHQLQVSIPVEFQLPEDIRAFFKDGLFLLCRPFNSILADLRIEQLLRDRKGIMLIVQRLSNLALSAYSYIYHSGPSIDDTPIAAMVNWRTVMLIAFETGMVILFCVFSAACPPFLVVLRLLLQPQSVLGGQLPKAIPQMHGRA